MDATSNLIADYAVSTTFDDLDPVTVEAVKDHILDSLGCVLGGYNSEPTKIAAQLLAAKSSEQPVGRIYIDGQTTSIEMATFVNTSMLRYLDFNDTLMCQGTVHPSDVIPALVAVADANRIPGQDLILAIEIAYAIMRSFLDEVSIRERGWDQGLLVSIAVAAAVARMLGGTETQVANAISLGVVPSVPLRNTRAGELSMWKGCATAAAAKSGVFAANLAVLGMTGPTQPFNGRHGLFDLVTGPLDLKFRNDSAVAATNLKFHPTEYHSQAPIEVVRQFRQELSLDEISAIAIRTYWVAFSEIGSEKEKWRPTSRETADHSLPYILATMLRKGDIWLDDFDEERLSDQTTLDLMDKITIVEDQQYTDSFPDQLLSQISISTVDGRTLVRTTEYPKGHVENPMTHTEILDKVHRLRPPEIPAQLLIDLEGVVERLELLASSSDLVDAFILS